MKDRLLCFTWVPSLNYAQKEHLLQKGATTISQPGAESSVEAVPSLVKDLSKLSVKEQSSQNRLPASDYGSEVNSSLQLPHQAIQNSSDPPTLIDELFKVPAGKAGAYRVCTGSSTPDESFHYRRTAKVSSTTSTYLIESSLFTGGIHYRQSP